MVFIDKTQNANFGGKALFQAMKHLDSEKWDVRHLFAFCWAVMLFWWTFFETLDTQSRQVFYIRFLTVQLLFKCFS